MRPTGPPNYTPMIRQKSGRRSLEPTSTHFPPYPPSFLIKHPKKKCCRRRSLTGFNPTMLSSSLTSTFHISSSATTTTLSSSSHNAPFKPPNRSKLVVSSPHHPFSLLLHKSLLPVAASAAILLCSAPAEAGFMSGISGIESVPGPELPSIDFLNRFNEENQKKYAKDDERIRSSPIIKELLERSKLNKEKNKQEIMDKYCLRGAEWGVGDCSTTGMTPQERDDFIAMLKKKVEAPK